MCKCVLLILIIMCCQIIIINNDNNNYGSDIERYFNLDHWQNQTEKYWF